MVVFGVRIEVVGSLWWQVLDIGIWFGPEGPEPSGRALGLDVSVLCQD